jgi:diacylglycerol kinase family enzyme
MRRVDVVLNRRSGASDKEDIAARVSEALRARGVEPQVRLARTAGDLMAGARAAALGDAEIVIAGGGDGTISAVAASIAGSGKVLGVLPLGTFNFFARRLHIPLELDAALDVIATATPAPLDVGDVNGHLFLNNASIGLYPAALERRETTYRRIGRRRVAAYLSTATVLLQPPALLNLRITADGRPLARRTPLLFISANAAQMETFAIPGRECIDSGRLAAYITRELAPRKLAGLAIRAFFRGLHGAPELEVICARELLVSLRRRRVRVAMDGEIRILTTPLTFRWRPGALRVLAGPPPADATAE